MCKINQALAKHQCLMKTGFPEPLETSLKNIFIISHNPNPGVISVQSKWIWKLFSEAATEGVLIKKAVETRNFIKKETLTQVFSYEFSKIFKIFFTEHLWTIASVFSKKLQSWKIIIQFSFINNNNYGILSSQVFELGL